MSQNGLRDWTADQWKTYGPVLHKDLVHFLNTFRNHPAVKIPTPDLNQSGFLQDPELSAELRDLITNKPDLISHLSQILPKIDAIRRPGAIESLESRVDSCVQLLENFLAPLKVCPFEEASEEIQREWESFVNRNKQYIFYIGEMAGTSKTELETFVSVYKELVDRVGPPAALMADHRPQKTSLKLLNEILKHENYQDGSEIRKIKIDTLYLQSPQEFQKRIKKRSENYLVMQDTSDYGITTNRTEGSDADICNRIIYGCGENNRLGIWVEVAHMEKPGSHWNFTGAPKVDFKEAQYRDIKDCYNTVPKVEQVALFFAVSDTRLTAYN